MSNLSLLWPYLLKGFLFIALCIIAAILLQKRCKTRYSRGFTAFFVALVFAASVAWTAGPLKTYGPSTGPFLPLSNILLFLWNINRFERVPTIAQDTLAVPPPISRTAPAKVHFDLVAKEVISEIAPGVAMNYWTINDKVPGPFLRVREGDTVEITFSNDKSSLHHHSIDLHAVTGPGGGAVATMVEPGESKTFSFKALHPGLFVYHCAEPNVAVHMAHGMYGLILVEPAEGLPKVDKEFYVMQGELYTTGALGKSGLQMFDAQDMLDSKPQYVVFNGKAGGLQNMQAHVGEKVRVYLGNGGVNLDSNFHVIGEIFDTVFPEGALRDPIHDVQTTLVPAGGASVVEFDLNYPGNYVFVDHALARLDRGAWGVLKVDGEPNPSIFNGVIETSRGH